jgi:drug/metabolite transporter (DMT)-like permease
LPAATGHCQGQKPGVFAAIGVVLAATGLGLLSLGRGLSINYGDLLVFFCALCFAIHIITVGRYARHLHPPLLALIQIGIVSLAGFLFGLATETWPEQIKPPGMDSSAADRYTGHRPGLSDSK